MMISEGTLLGARYRLDTLIATGGMGQVWRATDELLGRPVAVKLLQTGGPALAPTTGGSSFRERFRSEARSSASLSHPNIAAIYDFDDDAEHPYLVMELVDGSTLAQVLVERGPLTPEEVSSILGQAALALDAAHRAGVVHRDVKPANIMLTADGMVKLTDFGIARVAAASGLTRTGEVLGTPHYLSPEQARGEHAVPASDIYALGVVGHELLTGVRPFEGDSMVATALAHVTQPAPELPDTVPDPLRATIMAALAKDRTQRPASAGELAARLGVPVGPITPVVPAPAATAVVPVTSALPTAIGAAAAADPAAEATTTVRTHGRRRWLAPAGAVAALLVVILAVALATGGPGTPAQGTPTSPPASTTGTTPSTTTTTTQPASTTSRPATTAPSAPRPPAGPHGKGKGGKHR